MCDCIATVNANLAEHNTQLDIPILWNSKTGQLRGERVQVAVRKLDEKVRIKPIPVLPAYCPFCGKLYPADDEPKTEPSTEVSGLQPENP